jgi:hypothetical protein
MSCAANDRGMHDFVLSKETGEVVSEVLGSGVWRSIGSSTERFYSVFSQEPAPGQRPKYMFILKHTPEFNIESYGVFCEFRSLHSIRSCGDYVYGDFENCAFNEGTIPHVTAIFNMGANSVPIRSNGLPSKGVKPVLLEGTWHIKSITSSEIELIGQPDPNESYLTKMAIPKSWLE